MLHQTILYNSAPTENKCAVSNESVDSIGNWSAIHNCNGKTLRSKNPEMQRNIFNYMQRGAEKYFKGSSDKSQNYC